MVLEVENPSFLRRMTMQPYNIVCLLFCWILCNLGMISPLLPVAVAAQVIMGTVSELHAFEHVLFLET